MTTQNYYHNHTHNLKKELRETIDAEKLRELHKKIWWKHIFIVFRQLTIAAIAIYGALAFEQPFIWFPCSVILGFIAFGWTVLLHEVIHEAIFAQPQPFFYTLLGYCYAIPGGMAKSQFTHWHLDHHSELGCSENDPKRAYLTPKIITRWYKFLYMTPALFPIYFRAAAKATTHYPDELKKRIKRERLFTILCHFSAMFAIGYFLNVSALVKIYIIPYFFIFPIAFTCNRLGQHYNINPEDPAHWSTLIPGNFFWDFVYLYSNYHLEHHYFPRVPFYNLPQLQKLLQPIYTKHNILPQSYTSLLYSWFIQNKIPHSNWLLD